MHTRKSSSHYALALPQTEESFTAASEPHPEPAMQRTKRRQASPDHWTRRLVASAMYGLLLGSGFAKGTVRPLPDAPRNPRCLQQFYDFEHRQRVSVSGYDYHPDLWNFDYLKYTHNDAYQYAIDRPHHRRHLHRTQGGVRFPAHRFDNCTELRQAALDDGLAAAANCSEPCAPGNLLIAGYIGRTIYGPESHWLRSHADPNVEAGQRTTMWSHKRPSWPVENVDLDGNVITDLDHANFDYHSDPAIWNGVHYTDACGCFCAPCEGN